MSSLFKKKTSYETVPTETPKVEVIADPYSSIRSWVNSRIGQKPEAYSGDYTKEYGGDEFKTMSEQFLKQFANAGPSEGRTLAMDELRSTLTGKYDPVSSPYYQAVKAEAAKNMQDTQSNIAAQAAGGGRYWTGARLEQQQESATDITNSLNTFIGQLAEAERARKLQAAPMAAELGKYEEELPLQKSQALYELGSVPKYLEWVRAQEAAYNEWLRQQEAEYNIAQLAMSVPAPLYGRTGTLNSSNANAQMPMVASGVPSYEGVPSSQATSYAYNTPLLSALMREQEAKRGSKNDFYSSNLLYSR